MSQQTDAIKDFTEKFFTNLKCTLKWQGNVLHVSNVPKDFEEFSGKSQPYLLAFDSANASDESELMVKGNYLLKVMMDYLDTSGQTTLLKLVFDSDLKDLFVHRFNLKNSTLSTVNPQQDYRTIFRFTFLTTLQYLNEREQVTSSISIRDGVVLSNSVEGFKAVEGRKEDLIVKEVANAYNLAKEQLKPLITDKISNVRVMLQSQLENEINRIKEHYAQLAKEYETSASKFTQQIAHLEDDLKKGGDVDLINQKISRAREGLRGLEQSGALEKIRKEEAFFINDEIHKRGLSVTNKLINTTVFYYPVYTLRPFLKTADAGRIIEINYDPVDQKWSNLNCDVCGTLLDEVVICLGGHMTCPSCASPCPVCSKEACKKCLDKRCVKCERPICKKCAFKCSVCRKDVCPDHLRTFSDAQPTCVNCVKSCSACHKMVHPSTLRTNALGRQVCDACYRRDVNDRALASVFEK